jgi:hypothetical protein
MNERQKAILKNALGIKKDGDKGYRNHFVAGEGHDDSQHLDALTQAGYMTVRDAPMSSGWLYQVTDKGREALGLSKESSGAAPICPRCGDGRQVWKNQITGLLTCHRAFCNTVITPKDCWKDAA